MKIAIIDIDGTISKVGERLKYLKIDPPDWDTFYEDCFDDLPIKEIIELVLLLQNKCYLYFCTGRRESVREKTMKWLRDYGICINDTDLLMRADNDFRHDTEVKPELIKKAGIKLDEIFIVLEDRNSMVKKWREMGLTCLQVADGDF